MGDAIGLLNMIGGFFVNQIIFAHFHRKRHENVSKGRTNVHQG